MGRLEAEEVALVSREQQQAVAVLDALTYGHLLIRGGTCHHQPQPPRTQKNPVTGSSAPCVSGSFARSPLCYPLFPLPWAPRPICRELPWPLAR